MKATLTLFLFVLIGTGSAIFSQTVTIGTQVWMTKNLDVSTFRNGDSIPQAKTNEEWKKAGENKQPTWCYHDNDTVSGSKYGKLYNWYAVSDSRGLAPVGYHIPSDTEWTILFDYLGGEDNAGTKMKSTSGWENEGNGTNSSGFSGLPGGYRSAGGKFIAINCGFYWSSTERSDIYFSGSAFNRVLEYFSSDLRSLSYGKEGGLSVRCLRD